MSEERQKKWPYPIEYEKEVVVSVDVLVVGGGIAGCHAALAAAEKGAKVAVVDKGPVIRSGSGGAGVDHWHMACTNPCCKIPPDEMIKMTELYDYAMTPEYGMGPAFYITCKESYDTLLELEKLGMVIRDEDDEFAGAEFRDDETKLMFAYDYSAKYSLRVKGFNVKPILYKGLKTAGVDIHDYIMVTSLLTEGGKQGQKVIGATGFHVRTGAFYIFKAKSVILTSGNAENLWSFSTEPIGFAASADDPNNSGDGYGMAWKAGAEMALMEKSIGGGFGNFSYPSYGVGNAHNSWYACTIVDANGKEIPWVDRDGNILKTVSERYQPAPGQTFFHFSGDFPDTPYEVMGPRLIPDLSERIQNGEYELPFYADLPGMPELERKAIFGLMVGNEGKSYIPIYVNYTKAGFNPDKDQLQVPVYPPEIAGMHTPWTEGPGPFQVRSFGFVGGGGPVFDWTLKTTLEGLYVAGEQLLGGGSHATSAVTGRYAGRMAAKAAAGFSLLEPVRSQIDQEKNRIYKPVLRSSGYRWKELQAGICRIMQDYCGEVKTEKTMRLGLRWFDEISENEADKAYACNPHELWRVHEAISRITIGKLILESSLARKASSKALEFNRLDYPEYDPPEWNKFVTLKLKENNIVAGELPLKYWLLPPYSNSYAENYNKYSDK